jgi:hypothetical protein
LPPWKGSVTRCSGVAASAGGEAAPEREKEGDDASWADKNFIRLKIKKIHAIDSTCTNRR